MTLNSKFSRNLQLCLLGYRFGVPATTRKFSHKHRGCGLQEQTNTDILRFYYYVHHKYHFNFPHKLSVYKAMS
ncbi:hypothetical protein NC651_004017 [Populus alba x Populus x berolinensis]|nr:hypothetical protein NC651_004017 [Populus alba x Populus x berolinensis]